MSADVKMLRDEDGVSYLLEGEFAYNRAKAMQSLAKAKEVEQQKKMIPVWVDRNTTKLIDMDKVKKRKMELIRVKMGKGELVWMEKQVAIKNGFINE